EERADEKIAARIGPDDRRAAVKPAFPGPGANQQEKRAAASDENDQSGQIECAEPDPRGLISYLGEERYRDNDEANLRPGRHEPEVLLFVTAECLDLIDIGSLKRAHRQQGDRGDRAQVGPGKAIVRDDIGSIKDASRNGHESKLDQANRS